MNRTTPGGVASSSPVSRTSVLGWGLTRTIRYGRTRHNSPLLALELLIVQRTMVGCPSACSSNGGTLSGGRLLIHDFALSADRRELPNAALFLFGELSASAQTQAYTVDELEAAMQEAGYVDVSK